MKVKATITDMTNISRTFTLEVRSSDPGYVRKAITDKENAGDINVTPFKITHIEEL